MICNRDCFNCPFPDCVCDDESQDDIDAAERRDLQIQAGWDSNEKKRRRDARYREKHREKAKINARAYYAANKEYVKEKHAEWYKANRDRVLAQQKAYREANKDKIRARNKEKYRKKKEAAQVQAGTAPDRGNDHNHILSSCPVPVKGAG